MLADIDGIDSRRQPFPYAGAKFFKSPEVEKPFRRIWDDDPDYIEARSDKVSPDALGCCGIGL